MVAAPPIRRAAVSDPLGVLLALVFFSGGAEAFAQPPCHWRPRGLQGPPLCRPGLSRASLAAKGGGGDLKQEKGYVIVPDEKGGQALPAQQQRTQSGWSLWDQRTRGVTVIIGNHKQRRKMAKEGVHFGPLAAPDMAKLQYKLDELLREKKALDQEAEEAESQNRYREVVSQLKKKKLALKDRIAVLQNNIDSYNPTDYQPKMLGEGAYGAILLGRDVSSGEGVAIKVEPITKLESAIAYEYGVFSKLKGIKGFPTVKYFGQQRVMNRDCRVMVMELLGESVEDLWWEVTGGGRGFETATALAVAEEMLGLLEQLHMRGYVHRDVKPDNFLVHNPDGSGHLVLIDLGISKSWQLEDGTHMKEAKSGEFFGTCRYASIYSHQGVEQSRRDDLESLAYTIVFLLAGKLPWEHPTSDVGKVGIMKLKQIEEMETQGCDLEAEGGEDLCALLGEMSESNASMIQDFIKYCRGLSFEEDPDYDFLRSLLLTAYKKETGSDTISRQYEWHEFKRQEAEREEADRPVLN